MKIKVSVIVSTYNRSILLKNCLSSLVNQGACNNLYEIIVVDNNSIDNTKKLVDNFIEYFPQFRINYLLERQKGLSYARNAGCENAKGEYLAYIDDDAKADNDWVKNIIKSIDKIKPDILGGPIYPYYLFEKPIWFKNKYEIRSNGETARFLRAGEYLSGSNLIIKKYILENLGKFNPNLGMRRDELRYGEETRLIIEAREKIPNIKIYYNPEIKVKHLVKKDNMVLCLRLKNKFIAGMHNKDIYGRKGLSKFRLFININIAFSKGIFLLFFGYFFRDKNEFCYYENYVFEKVFPQFSWLAKNLGRFLTLK